MPRLLLMTVDFPPQTGGVARYLDALATAFRDDVTVVAQASHDPQIQRTDAVAGYRVERARLYGSFFPRWIPMIREFIERRETYDIALVSHVLPVGTAAWIASWLTGKPYVVVVHGLDLVLVQRSRWKQFLASHILKNASAVVANSHALSKEVERTYHVSRAVTVYPGVSHAFAGVSRSPRNDHTVRLLTVSRLVPRKGHQRLLRVLSDMRRAGRLKDVSYTIIGDGPLRNAIESDIKQLSLESIVTLVTNADDRRVMDAYAQADVFLMPTLNDPNDREGFGTVYLEAAAFGVPSIATRLAGVDEAVLDGQTGLLVADRDDQALADAIEMLVRDPSMRERLGANARERVSKEFLHKKTFEPLRNILYSREVNC